jgi:MoaA/NifB/PqqE/SkfB family radical SAM enzyme
MSPEFVRAITGELRRSGVKTVSLGGGEPLLNPHFIEIAERLVSSGFKIRVFTGGPRAPENLDFLAGSDPEKISIVLNVTAPGRGPAEARGSALAALSVLGKMASPAFTVSNPDDSLDFLLDDAEKCGAKKNIRLGIAQPAYSGRNRFLKPEFHRTAGDSIARFAALAAARGFKITLDCGFTRCMFDAAPPEGAEFFCTPALDVWNDGSVSYCLALAGAGREPLGGKGGLAGAQKRLLKKIHPFKRTGLFARCRECPHLETGVCGGGCISQIMRTFKRGVSRPGGGA